jgi:small-conductance mechanosensitive channel
VPRLAVPRWVEGPVNQILAGSFLDNSAERWAIAIAVLLGSLLLLRWLRRFLGRRFRSWGERLGRDWVREAQALVEDTRFWFLLILAARCSSLTLTIPDKASDRIADVTVAAVLIQGAILANRLIVSAIQRQVERRVARDAASAMTIAAAGYLARIALWVVVGLMMLANFGVDVTALVAGLGIGGVAVALAAQNILSDLFASLSIVLDKPFVVGDFIVVGDFLGAVEHVGLKTTRLRSLSGEQLIFSNNDLLQSRIRNYQRMAERRIAFSLGVVYQTPYETLGAIPGLLREIVESQAATRFDRAHFQKIGDAALVFEVVYYVRTADYNEYMDIQQRINLAIFQRWAERGIEFAYPTQTLFLQRTGAASPPR